MLAAKPTPFLRPGMDFVAGELEVQHQRNAELVQRIRDLELRLVKAEDKLKKIDSILKSDV